MTHALWCRSKALGMRTTAKIRGFADRQLVWCANETLDSLVRWERSLQALYQHTLP